MTVRLALRDQPSPRRVASAPIVSTWLFGSLGLLASLGGLLVLELHDHTLALDLAATGATLVFAAVFAADYARDRNALSPICMSAVLLFLLFPLHAWMTRDSQTLTLLIGSDADVWRTRALLVAAVSAPFLLLGYRSRLPGRVARALRSPGWILDDHAAGTRSRMFLLYAVGFLPRLLALAAGQGFHWENPEQSLEELQFVLSILGNLPLLACAWFVVTGLGTKRRDLLWIGLAMLGVELAWSFLSGSRMRVLTPLIALAIAVGHTVVRVTVGRAALLLVAFAFVVLPFVTAFKASYFERMESIQREGVSAGAILDSLTEAGQGDPGLAKGEGPVDLLAERFHGATSLALIIRYTPERHDYYFGVPYLMVIPQILIPRVVWSDKPPMNPFGNVFRFEYWGLEPTDQTAISISLLGDLWVNLHLPGCILGMMLFGAIIAFVAKHLRYGLVGRSVYPTLVFAVHMPVLLHAHENNFDGTLAGLPKSLFVYFVLAWLISARAPGGPPDRAR